MFAKVRYMSALNFTFCLECTVEHEIILREQYDFGNEDFTGLSLSLSVDNILLLMHAV